MADPTPDDPTPDPSPGDATDDVVPTPVLMRGARGAYARSIRAQLHASGIDDLPRNGSYLLTEIHWTDGLPAGIASDLGVTKQAVSQVVDTLVQRGYLDRSTDSDDRRRIALALTAAGERAVEATARGVDAVDAQLREKFGGGEIDAMRSVLRALAEIKTAGPATGAGRVRPIRQFRSFSPIFGVRTLADALAHYRSLGFTTLADEDGHDYGFANRGAVGLHLAADPDHDPTSDGGAAYLSVADADALYAEWSRPAIGGRTHPPGPTDYGRRQGSHIDPDGNLIRFGSPMEE